MDYGSSRRLLNGTKAASLYTQRGGKSHWTRANIKCVYNFRE